MCLFPLQNSHIKGKAYKSGLISFNCGCCPECLRSRANALALRAVYESRQHVYNCMVTLTYDSYIYDGHGKVIGERVSDLKVCKRDVQLFVKRLRKYFGDRKIKYLITAEYGKRTHRAHYHAILFGVRFPDLVLYKKSKRGNYIYKSAVLTRLWHNGICTVDSVNITGSVARYCTKYVVKDSARASDTFTLMSQGLGLPLLLKEFNGKSYLIDGYEYPIPRRVWQEVITSRYDGKIGYLTARYVNRYEGCFSDPSYKVYQKAHALYLHAKENDSQYKSYKEYWNKKILLKNRSSGSVFQRILALDNKKYFGYKQSALQCYSLRLRGIPATPPRFRGIQSSHARWLDEYLPLSSCHIAASDTKLIDIIIKKYRYIQKARHIQRENGINPFDFSKAFKEIEIF